MSIKSTSDTPSLAPLMSAQQVQDLLGIKRTKLYDLIDQGLPYISLSPAGRTKLFDPAAVQAWLDGRRQSKGTPATAPERPRRGRPAADAPPSPSPRKWIK